MGKEQYINPGLSSTPKKGNEPTKQRKTRSDKLHDIKIPVTENMDLTLRRESRRNWNSSKTALSTEILLFGLDQLFVYPEVPYEDLPLIVHCRVNNAVYQRIGEHADKWNCSIRKAAHRIFMEAYKKKQFGGITNE